MPLQISMLGAENKSLPSHISMASLPVVRLKFSENLRICLLVNTVPTYSWPIVFRLIMVTACMASTGGQKEHVPPISGEGKLE